MRTEVITSEALEAATILCGAGQEDLVYRVRPRRLADTVLQVLGFRLDKAMQCSAWSDRPLGAVQL